MLFIVVKVRKKADRIIVFPGEILYYNNHIDSVSWKGGIMMEAIVWLSIFVVLLIIEAATLGLTTIWFAGGALAALILAWFQVPVWIQFLVFVGVSILLLVFTRPAAERLLRKTRTRTNADRLMGEQAVVLETVNNLKGTGSVRAGGLDWMARTEQDSIVLEQESIVEIVRIEGVKLIVKRKES